MYVPLLSLNCPLMHFHQGLLSDINLLLEHSWLLSSTRGSRPHIFCASPCQHHSANAHYMRQNHWPYMVPQLAYILTYMLSVVICIAVFIMLCWHLWGIARGETTVEAQDHEVYKRIAKDRGDVCGYI